METQQANSSESSTPRRDDPEFLNVVAALGKTAPAAAVESIRAAMGERPFQLLLIANSPRDRIAEGIEVLAEDDPRISGLVLSAPVVSDAALTAGLKYASGDATLLLDIERCARWGELLTALLEKYRDGSNLVQACPSGTKSSRRRKLFSRIRWFFYRVDPIQDEPLHCCLLDRTVVERLQTGHCPPISVVARQLSRQSTVEYDPPAGSKTKPGFFSRRLRKKWCGLHSRQGLSGLFWLGLIVAIIGFLGMSLDWRGERAVFTAGMFFGVILVFVCPYLDYLVGIHERVAPEFFVERVIGRPGTAGRERPVSRRDGSDEAPRLRIFT